MPYARSPPELSLQWCWQTSATCHPCIISWDTAVTPEGLTLYLFSLLSSQRTGLSITLALKNVSFPLNPWKSFFLFVCLFTISLTITLLQRLYEYVKGRELAPPMRLQYTWYCWNPANGVMMNYNDNSIFLTCFSFIFFISL